MKAYQKLASLVAARLNCITSSNCAWRDKHEETILQIVSDYLPSGSGIDSGTEIDLDASTADKLVFTCGFHHMTEHGLYDGWTHHTITVRPDWHGIKLTVSGKNYNGVKDYLGDIYSNSLMVEV